MLGLLDSTVSVCMPSQDYVMNYNKKLRSGANMAYYLED